MAKLEFREFKKNPEKVEDLSGLSKSGDETYRIPDFYYAPEDLVVVEVTKWDNGEEWTTERDCTLSLLESDFDAGNYQYVEYPEVSEEN
jgi:hypothetical protein